MPHTSDTPDTGRWAASEQLEDEHLHEELEQYLYKLPTIITESTLPWPTG